MDGAATRGETEGALEPFALAWDTVSPTMSTNWRRDWTRLTVFVDDPPEIGKVIETTNAIESLNYSLGKILKKQGAFPRMELFSMCGIWGYSAWRRNGRCLFQTGNGH
ncbi:MAG: transposase [Nitrospirota bacterium]